MKLKYEDYRLDETVPNYLASNLVSLVVHSLDEEGRLSVTNTLVRSVNLAESQISVSFVDGTKKIVILGDSAPYWAETGVAPVFGYPHFKGAFYLSQILYLLS